MKTTAKILFLLVLILASCSKKKGCRDLDALNYDPNAEADGACTYTQVIFYAGSNRVGGSADIIEKIEVYQLITDEEKLIGTIVNPGDENPTPQGCTPTEYSVVFEFVSGDQNARFKPRYYYVGKGNESGDLYELSPGSDTECIAENLTL